MWRSGVYWATWTAGRPRVRALARALVRGSAKATAAGALEATAAAATAAANWAGGGVIRKDFVFVLVGLATVLGRGRALPPLASLLALRALSALAGADDGAAAEDTNDGNHPPPD